MNLLEKNLLEKKIIANQIEKACESKGKEVNWEKVRKKLYPNYIEEEIEQVEAILEDNNWDAVDLVGLHNKLHNLKCLKAQAELIAKYIKA